MAVTLLIAGGLGNQMFQYAAAKALALRLGTELVIDTRFFHAATEEHKLLRITEIGIPERLVTYANSPFSPHGLVHRAWRQVTREQSRQFAETSLGYAPQFEQLGDGTVLVGNFQSPRYFEPYAERIFADTALAALFDTIAPAGTGEEINLHVRRGDYLAHAGFMLDDPLAYYAAALAQARAEFPEAPINLFSDDIDWCREQACFAGANFVAPNAGESPWADLVRMSRCKALIIANSSYSWWAGWFAGASGSRVFCPHRWISNLDPRTIEIYPASWHMVESG